MSPLPGVYPPFTFNTPQLKIDAQTRQLKRQEGNLTALREERELQLVSACSWKIPL